MRKTLLDVLTGVLAGSLLHCGAPPPPATGGDSANRTPPLPDTGPAPQDAGAAPTPDAGATPRDPVAAGQDASAALPDAGPAVGADHCAAYLVKRSATVMLDEKQMCVLLGPRPGISIPIGPHTTEPGACARLCKDAAFDSCQVPLESVQQYTMKRGEQSTCPAGYLTGGKAQLTCEVRVANPAYRPEGCPLPPIGRPPEGFRTSLATFDATDDVGGYLARAAEVEAASVDGFLAARDALATFGAPAELVRECEVAADDEARHAALVGALAARRGRAAAAPDPYAATTPSLIGFALENATTGVVRETFGALLALHQAANAPDADVRDAMDAIARDECAHAALSFAIDAWLATQLEAPARAEVLAARRRAVTELDAAIATGALELPPELGMPAPATARRMLAALDTALWA